MTNEEFEDEFLSIEAIYPEYVNRIRSSTIELSLPSHPSISLQISFPSTYPNKPPNILSVKDTAGIYNLPISFFSNVLNECFHPGEVCVFDFLLEIENVFNDQAAQSDHLGSTTEVEENLKNLTIEEYSDSEDKYEYKYEKESHNNYDYKKKERKIPATQPVDPFEGWIMSEPVTDRKSTFIAHVAKVTSLEEAETKMYQLLSDRKIGKASHNMTAWRIKNTNGTTIQDCDDDGETAAGGRLLHLLSVSFIIITLIIIAVDKI